MTAASPFASLLAPVAEAEFFADYWEQQPLHLARADPGHYRQILTADDLRHVIAFGGLRYPAIQLARGGAFVHPEVFCDDVRSGDIVFTGIPNPDKLQAEFRAGATLSLPGFNRAWQPLRQLGAAVEARLGHAVHVNIYITPGNAQGFTPHYDPHEVFILQIAGRKHWTVHAPPMPLPCRTQAFAPAMLADDAVPLLERVLEPGDLLYLPRGFVHAARALDDTSVHVTLGVTVYTYLDLLSVQLQAAQEMPGFRQGLPPGFLAQPHLQRQIAGRFADLLTEFSAAADTGRGLRDFLQRAQAGYPGRCDAGQPFELNAAVVGPGTRFRVIGPDRYRLTEQGGDVLLSFAGRTLAMSSRARPALELMIALDSFTAADLPAELAADTRLQLLRHLYQEGFLTLAR